MSESLSTPLLLEMQDIDKSFGGVAALRRASLSVAAGEVHALIGQNGAGKSTLIKILTGAYRRDAGLVYFAGREVDFTSPQAARNGGISTIYQEINLVPMRSIAENIFLGREPRRFGLIDWRSIHRQADTLLSSFGLSIDVHRPVAQFSTAVQQMVALARAVSANARMVIIDESTSSLDEREVELLFTVVRRLRDDGRAVIFVSHRLDELYAICDRVTVMRDGQTVAAAPMAEMDKLQLVTTMLGRSLAAVVRHPAAAEGRDPSARGPVQLTATHLRAAPKVQDVSLAVHAGEAVGLAGLLGAGRTETMRLMFGAEAPGGGTLSLAGEAVALKSPQDAIRRGMGLLTEDRKAEGIVPELSVRDNLTLVCLPTLVRRGVVDRRVQKALVERFIESLGIKLRDADQPIRELSGGNQQKVLLARWLASNPKLLLLDEPTRGIDVGAKAEIAKIIRELRNTGMAVLLTASELEELIAVADRAVVMRDGRSVAELDGAALSEASIMDAIAFGAGAPSALAEAAQTVTQREQP
ncbi:Fructose import ATP-binding protein FruK [Pararobbsia alpina]|uniref:Fructose import ATP-binding protein FruK n=2 Tax=Pararobbsia alpina TaxID=621374 RepID=A0A6S7AXU3_9BURK|nr:Fructose import ATP-binding protein FruK [Pararobbsia alpina]